MDIIKSSFNLENTYAGLPKSFFFRQTPSHVPSPEIVILNHQLIESLGLDKSELEGSVGLDIFSGNKIPEGAIPISEAYAGHQFGYFTMLGDGRAVLLGEQITPDGDRYDIQLKGSGKTPFSRGGDGKATLGPMLREYIISEAMYALGIPTTRSLAVVTTGEMIVRDKLLPGAILTRVSKSHIRIGTFEYISSWGTLEELRCLVDYTIKRHFNKEIINENPYLYLFKRVLERQAQLIAKWQAVGFIHGVMNTDNVMVSGETIDYGPCAFMDIYDPKTVFSSIDEEGRYAYHNQPQMVSWNLARFAESLIPLWGNKKEEAAEMLQKELLEFPKIYNKEWLFRMRSKLGIFNEESEDEALIKELLDILYKYKADYTNTFIDLTLDNMQNNELFLKGEFTNWYTKWQQRLTRQDELECDSKLLMKNSNPSVIPRNHRVEEALEAAVEHQDYSVMTKLLAAVSKPYEYSKEQEYYRSIPKASSCRYKTYCGT